MQNLMIAMMRFSAAVTLYGMEQVQKSMNVVDGGEDMSKAMDRLEKTLNSLTDTLVNKIDDSKKETLKSVTKMSEDVIGKTMDGVSMMDPREVLKATNDLMQKTSDATADWVSKAASAVEKATDDVRTEKAEQPA
jgi:GTPase involved in cell partitioning and DNA repair